MNALIYQAAVIAAKALEKEGMETIIKFVLEIIGVMGAAGLAFLMKNPGRLVEIIEILRGEKANA